MPERTVMTKADDPEMTALDVDEFLREFAASLGDVPPRVA
ncbi:hypothetical protein EDE08_10398 [Bradyrhizobium sp. R2.2-H]|jgi:hypothetical protein|nr:hypothetical protein EDE10_10397 [Bradyrhizobium sp. Y-H1]TCU77651.1 hypothetical protein EDE08_10398 [Bradyrhizobium sp. R2.2-H]